MKLYMPIRIEQQFRVFAKSCVMVLAVFAVLITPNNSYAQNAPTIIRDTEIEEIFQEWMEPLLEPAGLVPNSVDFILVQSDQVNAFVAGGANIFFYTGLIEKTDNPGEVIGVLAHELGHIAGGHLIGARGAFERASYQSILGIVLGIGAAIATGDGRAAGAIIQGSNQAATVGFLAHSRVAENSADQAAFKYLEEAEINPSGLVSFFEKLKGQEYVPASRQIEYARTHPLTSNRIEAIESLAEKSAHSNHPYPPEWVEQHARMKAKIIGYLRPQQIVWEYNDRDTSVAAEYARAVAAYRLNNEDEAVQRIDGLIEREPENPYFYELKGQMLVDFARVQDALAPYRKAVELKPDAGLIRIALAHALIEGQPSAQGLEEAIGHLDRALEDEDRSSRAHRLLATAYGRLGHDAFTKYHLAEEAVLQRRLPYAKKQAETALQGFDEGSREWLKAKDLLAHIENLKTLQNRS